MIKQLTLLMATLVLAGCARLDPPAPITHFGTQSGRSSDQMTVRKGDTVHTLAKLFNVSMRDLMDINGLRPPYNLQAGQVIKIPIPSTYTVQQEDTLYGISRAYGVDQTELARLNNLATPYKLELEQKLRLPYRGPKKTNYANNAQTAGRSFWSSARDRVTGNATTSDDIVVNDVQSTPIVGRRGAVEVVDLPPPPTTTSSSSLGNVAPTQAVPAPISITERPTEVAAVEPTKPTPSKATKKLPTGTPHFSWPVQGATLSEYGPKSGGRHNDGINIGAPNGTAVRAAEAGEVVYAGNELAGFGNLVLVRHAQGWMTAYGHMGKATVKRGAVVKKGQTIGAVGKTGSVKAPQLHFEIRKGSKALNPTKYLP